MDWDAKLDWAEEIYTMLMVLPVPVLLVTGLFFLGPWLHRRSLKRQLSNVVYGHLLADHRCRLRAC